MRLTKPLPKSPRSLGGIVWPTIRLIILLFNFLLILNLVFFTSKEGGAGGEDRKTSTTAHTVINNNHHHPHHDQEERSMLLEQCHEDSFDLRNERQRHHKSPFDDKICDALPLGATAASLWRKNSDLIYQASIHPFDKKEIHGPWTKDLLNLVTPQYLQRGLRTEPSHDSFRRIIQIVQRKLQDPDNAPALHVAVVGGSVTEGGGCDKIPGSVTTKEGERPVIRGNACAWPLRLQLLVDKVFGEGVIHVYNLAVGGTNSNLAIPVLDYWLFPHGSPLLKHGPDVIINGYAANDNLPPPNKRGEDTNMTSDLSFFYSNGMGMTEKFIRTSLMSRPCQNDPLVIYLDEYLGNQHNLILGELFRFEGVDILTNWYANAAAISPAHVVRRLVYGNIKEDLFTAHWTSRKHGVTKRKIDVHFGMPGHVHIAWTIAYAVLEMTLNFCEEETSRVGDHVDLQQQQQQQQQGGQLDETSKHHYEQHHDVSTPFLSREALELVEQEIPPKLNVNTKVKDLGQRWRDEALERKQSLADYCGKDDGGGNGETTQALPCSLAFVAAPMGTVRNAGALNGYMKKFIMHNDGWSGQQDMRNGWQNKLGYVAQKANATVSLRILETPNQVKTIILHTLKSYGEKWDGSEAKFTLSWKHDGTGKSYSTSWNILGYHNQQTSIGYPFRLDLEPDQIAQKGSTLDLQIDLIGGSTFKINSMMICSR